MKAPTVRLRPTRGPVIAVEVIALAAFGLLPLHRFGWWPATAISVLAALLGMVTVYRRNVAGWVTARLRWYRQRRTAPVTAAAVDIPLGSTMCGVRVDEHEAITMVEVFGRPHAPTLLRGSTLTHTENLLPLRVLTDSLDQPGGLRLAIDIVQSGQRVRRGSGYPALYSTLLADRPAAGLRRTRLILRLDLHESVNGLAYRHSVGTAAAAAADRVVTALRQAGVRAAALTAAALDEALDQLSAGLAAAPVRPAAQADGVDAALPHTEHHSAAKTEPGSPARSGVEVGWRTVDGHPGHFTSYYFSPQDITTAALNQMWSLRSDSVVQTTTVRRRREGFPEGRGPVLLSALVRTEDPQPPVQAPTLYLNPLPGEQRSAALWTAPTGRPGLVLPTLRLTDPDDVEIPVGPTGILVGAALQDNANSVPPVHRDDLVMWPLTDPQRPTRILMSTSDLYVRQLIIRAAAAGERIAIYSSQPSRWHSVAQPNVTVVQRRRSAEFVPTIVVNDRPRSAPPAGLAATVITLSDDPDFGGSTVDLRFVQTSPTTVRVSVTSTGAFHDLRVVSFRQEQAWTG